MSMPDALIEKAAKAIALHEYRVEIPSWIPTCICGWRADRAYDTAAYDAHVARAVLETVADDIRAEALRDAADAWQQGGWGNAIPSPEAQGRVALVVNMSRRTIEWLRARADRIGAGGEPRE